MIVTTRDRYLYSVALQTASESTYSHKHGCIITKHGRIIALATNREVTHPHSHKHLKTTIHAEQRAIIKAQCSLRGAVLYSARVGGNEVSKPCAMCAALLSEAGISAICYYDGAKLVKVRLSN